MIDRILDNYHTKKLLEEIKWFFIVRSLDYRFTSTTSEVRIEVKRKKYDKKYYTCIAHIQKNESLKYLCNLDKFRESLVKIIDDYNEKE
jgi:hypothetical protein